MWQKGLDDEVVESPGDSFDLERNKKKRLKDQNGAFERKVEREGMNETGKNGSRARRMVETRLG